MPGANKVVFLKQSGETLSSGVAAGLWKPEGVRTAAEKIARAHKMRAVSNVAGIVVVSGAGNIVRGEELKKQGLGGNYADAIGRMATIQNTLVLSQALEAIGVSTAILLSRKMLYHDQAVLEMESYTPRRMKIAAEKDQVTLIAGGTGEDGVTTDHAVVHYAADYHKAFPDREVLVLKGTKYDGVFESDPAVNANVARYSLIGAPLMLADHTRYDAVDEPSLRALVDNRLDMRVYHDGSHDVAEVMRIDRHATNGLSIGTLIVHENIDPVVAT